MAGFTSCAVDSFRKELLTGTHLFQAAGGDTFKIGLSKAQASLTGTYDKSTALYSTITGNSDELATAGGYTAGGFTLTNVDPAIDVHTAVATFSANPSWTSATFTTRALWIYNTSKSNKLVALFDTGADQPVVAGTITFIIPSPTAASGLLRLA